MNETLSLAALGEITSLGALYDSREHLFINDIRLFNFTKLPKCVVQTIPNGHSYYKLCKEDTYSKKLELMNISGDLALKVACLPFSVKGSAKYLNEFKKYDNSIKWNLLYSRTTCNELVDLQCVYEYYNTHEELTLNETLFEGATHVVTGISWGSNAVLTIEYENSHNESVHLIESMLSFKLEYFNIGLSDQNLVSKCHNNSQLNETFKCEIRADMADLDGVCTNIEQAFEMFKSLPDRVKHYNDGKGVQIEFHLSSLEKVRKIFKMTNIKCEMQVRNLDYDFYARITNLFQEIVLVKQKILGEPTDDFEQREKILKAKLYKEIINYQKSERDSSLQAIENIFRDLVRLRDDYVNINMENINKRPECNNYLELINHYEKLIALNPSYAYAFSKKACLLSKLNKHEEALECCNKALNLNSNLSCALMCKSNTLFKLSKYSEAILVLDDSKESNLVDALILKGKCLKALSNYSSAIEFFDKALELSLNHVEAYIYKALTLKCINENAKAKELFLKSNDLINAQKDLESYHLLKGLILTNLDKYEEALVEFDKLIESETNNFSLLSEALNNKGNALFNLDKYEDSVRCYEKAISLDSWFSYAFNNLAISLNKLNKTEQALECFNKAIDLDPNCAFAYNNKGVLLVRLNKTTEAIECFNKSLNLDPNLTNAFNNKKLITKLN